MKELKNKPRSSRVQINRNNRRINMIPFAIVVAGILVAGTVLYSQNNTLNTQIASTVEVQQVASAVSSNNVKPVNSGDHVRGDINAPVKIVEFSDFECPFCKKFHPTMQRIVEEYGEDGRVVWIYRHFPLPSHPKARLEAAASELAAELGGNDKFWEYADKIFEITPSNNDLDLNLLPQIAEEVGLPRKPFEDLVDRNDRSGGKYASHIEDNYQDAITAGGAGTPYTVIIAPNGKTLALTGAQPYSVIKSIVEIALIEK